MQPFYRACDVAMANVSNGIVDVGYVGWEVGTRPCGGPQGGPQGWAQWRAFYWAPRDGPARLP